MFVKAETCDVIAMRVRMAIPPLCGIFSYCLSGVSAEQNESPF